MRGIRARRQEPSTMASFADIRSRAGAIEQRLDALRGHL